MILYILYISYCIMYRIDKYIANCPKQIFNNIPFKESQIFPTRVITKFIGKH